jgi:hypothetical protein
LEREGEDFEACFCRLFQVQVGGVYEICRRQGICACSILFSFYFFLVFAAH